MENTQDWELYNQGIEYKNKLNLFKNTDRNERFYAGHHWDGVDTGGLPQVRLNITKRIVNWKVAQVMSDMLSMSFSADNAANYNPNDKQLMSELQEVARLLSDYSKTTWERLKQDSMNEQGLLDANLSGDAIAYFYWDDSINAGGGVKGDIVEELIDNVCYFPGDTSDPRPNDKDGPIQPYIILAFRKLVSDVKKEAEYYATIEDENLNNGLIKEEIEAISADTDTQYRAGDRAKQEGNSDKNGGYCTVLLKMWVNEDTGTIYARKSTQSVIIRKDYDTGLHRYPVAVMNWIPRKNSSHGEAEATELIPNNIAINKLMATMILWTMLMAYPKPVHDVSRIPTWNNDITKAIPVDGDITGAAAYLSPPGLPASVQNLFDMLVQTTKDMAGANETALGDDSVTKTAAGIVALQKASSLPLSTHKRRFAQWIEDIGLIWLDFWLTKYNVGRMLTVEQINPETKQTEIVQVPFDGSKYNQYTFGLKIDVGASTQWSEIASIQTMDNLLNQKLITFRQYLERTYNGLIPDKEGLIDEIEEQEQKSLMQQNDKQFIYEIMARFIETLPPETKAQIKSIKDPLQMESQVKQMMMQQPQQQEPSNEAAKGPSTSIQFKDLPPEGKVQMAAQAGINITVEQAAGMNALPKINALTGQILQGGM
jgi:hypothetical protein